MSTPASPARVQLKKIFNKGLIFEPLRPAVDPSPDRLIDLEVKFNTRVEHRGDALWEVVLELSLAARGRGTGEPLYRLGIKQAGVFLLEGFDPARAEPFLAVWGPETLFPYVRSQVAATVQAGGYAPLHLQPMDFAAALRRKQAEAQAAAAGDPDAVH